jgi:outer membrane protein assembly factor BamD (BamD/ComL family)
MIRLLNKLYILAAPAIVLMVSACAITINISENLSPAEIIQRAHEALDTNRYNVAIQYYNALRERNQHNIDLVITAEYHIAHIHYKQKKYDQARAELTELLTYYNTPDEELLPQHFKRLAQIVLQNIEEQENRRTSRADRD